ncbi:sec-independent protein translocase protein TatB [Methylomagnum ishizawai]|uniref:Sec-independent protein translocase protein TatB n=1 Tax=Methylomagnum ishizawai TaxID=1760988 RepID=A0A1Y6D1V0_9GAMM|nr:Sec-independent protein translocase protein TatB [Methylomagnum ishizawai]SMF96919.1 sec-independent protein translocase protein TatB [Methylomagnum ishizawai]
MFDIGFSELVLVGVVALLVFGPERLPRVAREAGLWIRKARSMVASVKSEIDHELQLQELQQTLREQKQKLQQEGRAYVEGVTATGKEAAAKPLPDKSPATDADHGGHSDGPA